MELMGNVKVEAHGLADVAALGIAKTLEERITAPYIGNATITSGLIKLVAGSVGYSVLGKNFVGRAASGGFIVDGIEDITTSLLGGVAMPGASGNADAW